MVSLPSNPYEKESVDSSAHSAFQEYILRSMNELRLNPWTDPKNPVQTNGSFYARNTPFVYTTCSDEGKHFFVTLGKVGTLPTLDDLSPQEKLHVAYGGEVFTKEQVTPYAVRDYAADILKTRFNKLGTRDEERKGWEVPMDEDMLRTEIEKLMR